MDGEDEPVVSSAPMGRGRGRGRGGVPVLPTGVWSSLNGDAPTQPLPVALKQGQFDDAEGGGHNSKPAAESHNDHYQDARPRGSSFDLPVHQPRRQRKDFNLDQPYQQADDHHHLASTSNRKSFEKDAKGKDWTCVCGNVNWSWRSHCNTCQNAKPANLLTGNEVRDGAGSGFFERQERASMVTGVEVDVDGFDDFGRRVKKTAKTSSDASTEIHPSRSSSVDGGGSSATAVSAPETKEQAALRRLQEKYQFLMPTAGSLPPASSSAESTLPSATGSAVTTNRRSRSRSRSPPRSSAQPSRTDRNRDQNNDRRGNRDSRDRSRTTNNHREESSSFNRRDHSRDRNRDGDRDRRYSQREDGDRRRRDDNSRDRDRRYRR